MSKSLCRKLAITSSEYIIEAGNLTVTLVEQGIVVW
jgi:3-deoxy-D-arabino-heptulosonate 7-phosphate (DAHP) synthase